MENLNNGTSYGPKMDNCVSQAIKEWWKGLSKDEILAYLGEQPDVTADALREMLGGTNAILAFDVRFSASANEAVVNFHKN